MKHNEFELIRVVDDDEQVRSSLQFALEAEGWTTVGYVSAVDFLSRNNLRHPGCVICDIRMPGMSGLQLQREMNLTGNTLPIVFVTAHGDIEMAVKAVKDGAFDFLPKPVKIEKLIDVVDAALVHDRQLRRERDEVSHAFAGYGQLSVREKEVLEGVAEGLLNKQIAFNLKITEKTVIAHRCSLRKKLGLRTGSELTQFLIHVRRHPHYRPPQDNGGTKTE